MEGFEFRAPGARVRVDDQGVDAYSRETGGVRIPWVVITGVKEGLRPGDRAKRHCLTLELADGAKQVLPAPLGPPGRTGSFEQQARRLVAAYEAHGGTGVRVGQEGEPRDEIPAKYRLDQMGRVEVYEVSRWLVLRLPTSLLLLVLLAAGAVGTGGSVHAYTRDLARYDAFNAAPACTAADSAAGDGGPAYCVVTDGVSDGPLALDGTVYDLGVGPRPVSTQTQTQAQAQAQTQSNTHTQIQYAYFNGDQHGLDGLAAGTPVEYVAADGGPVASVVYQGETYETIYSPEAQHVYDWASVLASTGLTLLAGLLLGLRIARRSLRSRLAVPVLALTGWWAANVAVASNQPADRPLQAVGALLVLDTVAALAVAAISAVVGETLLRQRARLLVSRRHRAQP